MRAIALYTFGLLDPDAGPERLADFSRRGAEIFGASDHAPGLLGRADLTDGAEGATASDTSGADAGRWGPYLLPLGLPDFAGHDPRLHIATLSVWEDVGSARGFVYHGLHSEALRLRYDWFLRGPWPGHVLWPVDDGATPTWADGVHRLEALARNGASAEGFTFTSSWARDRGIEAPHGRRRRG